MKECRLHTSSKGRLLIFPQCGDFHIVSPVFHWKKEKNEKCVEAMAAREIECETPKLERGEYTTCAIDPEQRVVIRKLYMAWRVLEWKQTDFETLLETAGYNIPRRTLNDWLHAVECPDAPTTNPQKRGPKPLLDENLSDIVVGHCLDKISSHGPVHLETVVRFAKEQLGVSLSSSTASRFLEEHGFSKRVAKHSRIGTNYDHMELARMYSKWLTDRRADGLFDVPLSRLGSIDFTYTGHRTFLEKPLLTLLEGL